MDMGFSGCELGPGKYFPGYFQFIIQKETSRKQFLDFTSKLPENVSCIFVMFCMFCLVSFALSDSFIPCARVCPSRICSFFLMYVRSRSRNFGGGAKKHEI